MKTQIDPTYDPTKTNVIFVMEVGNDRYFNRSTTLAQAQEKYKQYCLDRRAVGWKVISITCYHRVVEATPWLMQELLDFNIWLRKNWDGFSNGIVDTWQDPVYRNALDTKYFHDGIHCTPAGNVGICDLAYLELLRLSR